MAIQNTWATIQHWLQHHAPQISLNAGASPAEIASLEAAIGASLPDDFKAFYALHNGQNLDAAGLLDGEQLLPIANMLNEWKIWKSLLDNKTLSGNSSPDPGIKSDWWNPLWIPITHDGGGNHLCIDLDPAEGGTRGQILRLWHDMDARPLRAASFAQLMQSYAHDLHAGKYHFSADYNGIIKNK